MNKIKFISLTAGLALAMAFIFSCSSGDDNGGELPSDNSFSYCLIDGQCLDGPFASKECGDLGGLPSNNCSYGGNSSSSTVGGSSSSSVETGNEPSSSSLVSPSSSSSRNSSSSSVGGNSSGGYTGTYGSVTHGSQSYKTVVIGTQTWMAQNLNYEATGSKCYGDDDSNCATYGRLYNWETAKTVCPSGWHLPTQEDWEVMTAYIGGASTEGKNLKATSGWNNNGNGTNQYGFSALPGGYSSSGGGFRYVGDYGYWWCASEYDSDYAYDRGMYYDSEYAYWYNNFESSLFSVRCLQD